MSNSALKPKVKQVTQFSKNQDGCIRRSEGRSRSSWCGRKYISFFFSIKDAELSVQEKHLTPCQECLAAIEKSGNKLPEILRKKV